MSALTTVCIFFHSRHGSTQQLAEAIAQGAREAGARVWLRHIPHLSHESPLEDYPDDMPAMTLSDLEQCDAFAYGSPSYFGNMTASMKAFWDSTSPLWIKGALIDKPAGVFTCTSSLHGGQESTLLSMMLPLLHHGCCCLGLPYNQVALQETQTGGTPYGPTHLAQHTGAIHLSKQELDLAKAFGRRLKKQGDNTHAQTSTTYTT